MLPSITVRGARESFALLRDIADRTRDASPAFDEIADDVFDFQRRWWLLTYGDRRDQDRRPGRKSQFMVETGGLRAAATQRGAKRQRVQVQPHFLLLEVTDGLAVIHEERDRPVLGAPTSREVDGYAAHVADYILTGRTRSA